MSKKLERIESVKERTGLCTSSIYEGMKAGWFPKNFAISKQARAWDSDEVDAWIAARIAARDDGTASGTAYFKQTEKETAARLASCRRFIHITDGAS